MRPSALRRTRVALARRGRLRRSSGLRRTTGEPTPPEVLEALRRRSGGRCELVTGGYRCQNAAEDPHHRLTKGRAGRTINYLWNLLHLCRSCHDWVHAHPLQAEAKGWLLPSTR